MRIFQMKEKSLHGFIILVICAVSISIHWGHWYPDSISYVSTMKYIIGDDSTSRLSYLEWNTETRTHLQNTVEITNVPLDVFLQPSEYRMLRPITLIVAAPLARVFGIINAFAIVNAIFWIATALLLYRFSLSLLNDSRLALYSTIIFTTSTTVLEYGAAVLTDAGGYFFALLTFYILYLYRDSESIRTYLMLSIILTIGALSREQTIPLFFVYLLVYERVSGSRRWKRIFYITGLTGLFVIGYYFQTHINPLNFYSYAREHGYRYFSVFWGVTPFVKSLAGAFGFISLFAILGFYNEKNKEKRARYFAMFSAVLFVLLTWPIMDYRFTFLLFPIILPLGSLGLKIFCLKLEKIHPLSLVSGKNYEVIGIGTYVILMNYYAYLKVGFQLIGYI